MAKTTLTYLLSLMEAQPEMIHFRITDGSDNVVYDQQNSEFDSEKAINEIKRFVLEVAQKINNKQKFSTEAVKEEMSKKGIPEFTIGHPLYGDDNITYLHFEDAYGQESK